MQASFTVPEVGRETDPPSLDAYMEWLAKDYAKNVFWLSLALAFLMLNFFLCKSLCLGKLSNAFREETSPRYLSWTPAKCELNQWTFPAPWHSSMERLCSLKTSQRISGWQWHVFTALKETSLWLTLFFLTIRKRKSSGRLHVGHTCVQSRELRRRSITSQQPRGEKSARPMSRKAVFPLADKGASLT